MACACVLNLSEEQNVFPILLWLGGKSSKKNTYEPLFVFFSPEPMASYLVKIPQGFSTLSNVVYTVSSDFSCLVFTSVVVGIWRKLPGIAGQWIFYTVLPCEFSHSAFLYSDSLKNNSWFSGDLFWLHMLVFWVNMSLVQAIIWDAQWSRYILGHTEKWPLGKLQHLVSHSRSMNNLFRLYVLAEISGLSHQLAIYN